MDQTSFDRIARLLGGATTRRTGLRAALGIALAGGALDADANARRKPGKEGPCGDGSRKANICTKNSDCCTGFCNTKAGKKNRDGKGRCRCVRKGGACTADSNCCAPAICANGICSPKSACPIQADVCASGCPHTTVQAAIDAAAAGGVIVIGRGTYTEALTIDKNLTLQGCPTATIIDPGATRTVTVTSATVELVNLVIAGTGTSVAPGGGIACTGSLTLSGTTTVSNGYADAGGGVLLEAEGSLTMKDSAKIMNCGGKFGGGVYAATSSTVAMMDASEISGNVTTSTTEGGGGGVWLGASTMTMAGSSSIRSNTSSNWGGGLVLERNAVANPPIPAGLTMSDNSTITGNTSTGANSGGGIWSSSQLNTATGTSTRVSGNSPDPQCYNVTC